MERASCGNERRRDTVPEKMSLRRGPKEGESGDMESMREVVLARSLVLMGIGIDLPLSLELDGGETPNPSPPRPCSRLDVADVV